MLSLMPFTPRYAIFYAIYPKLCYRLCHIPRSSAIFFLNVMLQYITLTPSYANSSYAMFSGQSRGRISGYCCITIFICWMFLCTLTLSFTCKPSSCCVFITLHQKRTKWKNCRLAFHFMYP